MLRPNGSEILNPNYPVFSLDLSTVASTGHLGLWLWVNILKYKQGFTSWRFRNPRSKISHSYDASKTSTSIFFLHGPSWPRPQSPLGPFPTGLLPCSAQASASSRASASWTLTPSARWGLCWRGFPPCACNLLAEHQPSASTSVKTDRRREKSWPDASTKSCGDGEAVYHSIAGLGNGQIYYGLCLWDNIFKMGKREKAWPNLSLGVVEEMRSFIVQSMD